MNDERIYGYDVFSRFTDRWPKNGDRLLAPGRDSFLAQEPDERNYRLLQGYKHAADILIQFALNTPHDHRNLIFPAIFNYRHYIELVLKAMINDHGSFVGIKLESPNHKLADLWELYLKIATAFDCDCLNDETVAVGNCIREIDAIDRNSTTFRYPRDRQGTAPPLPEDGIDLMQLHDVMNGIENFFECTDWAFTHEKEHLAEIAEMTSAPE